MCGVIFRFKLFQLFSVQGPLSFELFVIQIFERFELADLVSHHHESLLVSVNNVSALFFGVCPDFGNPSPFSIFLRLFEEVLARSLEVHTVLVQFLGAFQLFDVLLKAFDKILGDPGLASASVLATGGGVPAC